MTTQPPSSRPAHPAHPARAQQLALLTEPVAGSAHSAAASARTLRIPGANPGERRSATQLTLVRAEGLPPQLRLDSRTRTIGRAGIAELRRILADADAGTGAAASTAA